MNGKEIVARLKRLNDINTTKDIKQLTAALYPGAHCPLMGAMMAIGGIDDAVMVVLGTEECTYYTKKATIGGFSFKGIDNRCFSVVLNHHDVTFGCKNKLYSAIDELLQEISPKIVFLVTTCVLEVTGDDVDSMAEEMQKKHNIPILPVHTEHFKSANHLPGVRDTILACVSMIEEPEKTSGTKKNVNIIGQRLGRIEDTELYAELVKNGIEIGMMLPGGANAESIKKAANATVNIVVNELGIPFAKAMQRQFGTPYVMFEKYVSPERIHESYRELFTYLELEYPKELEQRYEAAKQCVEDACSQVAGMKYIYGNTALACFEYNAFLTEIGMEPLLIQSNDFPGKEDPFVQAVMEKYNPYVTKTANIAPLQYVYDELKPNLYFGHEYAMRLRAKGIEIVHDNQLTSKLGFEVTEAVVTELVRASEAAKELMKAKKEAM